ncbi:MAG: hypothetical protein KDN05_05105 [Verrucomicrobiae bacterium]|nr:hypothetical protein [Verrucomicrobiae bacterium]
MTTTAGNELASLLNRFGVHGLGGGDPAAGANVLAAMACCLANLAADEGLVVHAEGDPARLGVNLLVDGALSSGLVVDEVLAEARGRQDNLIRHLRNHVVELERNARMRNPQPEPLVTASEELKQVINYLDGVELWDGYFDVAWGELLAKAPKTRSRDLLSRQRFLVSGGRPRDLEKQLGGILRGRLLVHLGMACSSDFAEWSGIIPALVEGRHSILQGAETLRANFLLIDPMRMIAAVARSPDERHAWLGHFLWLSDGSDGPEVPASTKNARTAAVESAARFRAALDRVIQARLGSSASPVGKGPIPLPEQFHAAQCRWTAFLSQMEPAMPGISGAARNLLTSLYYGLVRMNPKAAEPRLTLTGIGEFARFLVRRAVHARAMVLHEAELAGTRSQIERLHRKLAAGPIEERELYRCLKIPAARCRDLLGWMEDAGLVRLVDRKWRLNDGARLDFDIHPVSLLKAS